MNYNKQLLKKARKIIQLTLNFPTPGQWKQSFWNKGIWYYTNHHGYSTPDPITKSTKIEFNKTLKITPLCQINSGQEWETSEHKQHKAQ